jgi:hypothetical protein
VVFVGSLDADNVLDVVYIFIVEFTRVKPGFFFKLL